MTVGGGWVLGTLAAFAVYLRLAGTRAVNSDGAAQALQAWDMLHGNLLLHGWTTSDVSFYSTELPQYMLVELVRGLGQDVVHIAAAMTYTLAVLLAALLARGNATGREAAAAVALAAGVMLAPQLGSGTNVLLSSPDHTGTSVPVLAAWLILDRARPRWRVPVVVSALLALALVADSAVLLVGVIPLVGVCAFRVARTGARWPELALGSGAVVAAMVAAGAGRVIRALGGYRMSPLDTQVAPLGEILRHNLPIAARCLLLLPGADFPGLKASPATFFVVLHLAGVAVAAGGIAGAIWRRGPNADLVSAVLLVGIAVNLLAFVVSTHVYAVSSAREIAPVLPLAAALAGRQLAPHLTGRARTSASRRVALSALGIALAGYLAGLGLELTAPAAAPQQAMLTSWLESHRLDSGLSGYWEASVVTLTSGDRVRVRPLAVTAGPARARRVIPAGSQVQASWYDPSAAAAHFVVLFPGIAGYPGFTQRGAVIATFGAPDRTYRVGRYTILLWRKNLLETAMEGG